MLLYHQSNLPVPILQVIQFHVLADTVCKFRHFIVRDFKHPIGGAQGFQLLFLEWKTKRRRRDMPVDMSIPLLAAQ